MRKAAARAGAASTTTLSRITWQYSAIAGKAQI